MDCFGPFQHEQIDFTVLQQSPLFLITGKTGSGKTTIFDAMCTALYGSTSGDERKVEEMRSKLADESEYMRIEFWFQQGEMEYHVVRRPRQQVAKKRGDGMRDVAATAEITGYVNGQEQVHVDGVKAVNQFIIDLLHLNQKQFTQFVLLPQGAFRRFLESNSNEKESILRELFNTKKYAQWVDELGQGIKQQKQQNEVILNQLEEYKTQLNLESGYDEEAFLSQLNQEKQYQLKFEQSIVNQQQNHKEQIQHYEKLCQLENQYREYKSIQFEYQKCQKQFIEMEQLSKQVKRSRQIQQLQPTYQQLVEAEKRKCDIQRQLLKEKANLQQLKEETEALYDEEQKLKSQETWYEGQLLEIERLEQKLQKVKEAQLIKTQLEEHLAEEKKIQSQLYHLREEEQQALEEQNNITEQLNHKDDIANERLEEQRLAHEYEQYEQKNQLLKTALQNKKHSVEEKKKQQEMLEMQQKELQQSKENWQCLQNKILLAEINDLARQLSPGTPCPLCGSTDHPKPHKIEGDLEEVAVLKEKQQKLDQKISVAQSDIVAIQSQMSRLDSHEEQALCEIQEILTQTNSTDEYHLQDKVKMVSEQLQQIRFNIRKQEEQYEKASQCSEQIKQRLEQLDTEIKELENRAQQCEHSKNEAMIRLEQLPDVKDELVYQAEFQEKRQEVDAYRESTQLNQKQLSDKQANWHKQEKKVATQETMLQELIDQSSTLREHLTLELSQAKLSYDDLDEVISETQLNNQEAQLDAYYKQQLTLETKLKSLQNVSSLNEEQLFTQKEQLEQQIETEQHHIEDKIEENQRLKLQLQDKQQTFEKMQRLLEQYDEQLRQVEQRMTVYEVLSGRSSMSNVSLERYVLQHLLSEVLELANHRLVRLTQGRYRLMIDTRNQARMNRSGLEILIYDDYAGTTRSVSTLSGGESFIVALALSLSFGDMIQQRMGRLQIEALFIDEGFGTLDADSLNIAMMALEEIESEGRVIGIISHVEELKQRVPQQIQVKANGNGLSHIQVQTS